MCGGTAGLIMMAMSAVSFSILSLLVHVLATQDAVPSFELITIRCVPVVGIFALRSIYRWRWRYKWR